MKIALINPPFLFPSKSQAVISHCLGLRSLSAYLKANGHDVEFIDALAQGYNHSEKYSNGYLIGLAHHAVISQIPEEVHCVGVSVPFSQLAPIAHKLIEAIKKARPELPIVMGGVYPSTQPELALTSKADFIVVGEGEKPLLDYVNGVDPSIINGLYCSKVNQAEKFQRSDFVEDLNTLPFPDYGIPNIERYFSLSPRMHAGRIASIVTSRGCPFACEFCSIHPVYGRMYRFRSSANVLQEIRYLAENFGVDTLEIEDDNFTLKKDRTIEILQGLIELKKEGIPLRWRTPNGVRIDTLDEDIIALMKESGCFEITLALEHGDKEMLEIMNKKLDLDKVYEVVKLLVAHKMKIVIFIIVGYPDETRIRFERGVDFLRRIKALGGDVTVLPNIAQPYPGTRLLQRCRQEGLIKDAQVDNFLVRKDLLNTGSVSLVTPNLSEKEILERRKLLLNLFVPFGRRVARAIMLRLPLWAVSAVRRIRQYVPV